MISYIFINIYVYNTIKGVLNNSHASAVKHPVLCLETHLSENTRNEFTACDGYPEGGSTSREKEEEKSRGNDYTFENPLASLI